MKYLDLDRELKKLGNMKLTVIYIYIYIVDGAFGTVLRSLEKVLEELEIIGRLETI